MESLWRHFKNLKTTRDAYLCLHLLVYIKNSSIHLVTQFILTTFFCRLQTGDAQRWNLPKTGNWTPTGKENDIVSVVFPSSVVDLDLKFSQHLDLE
jgi:hypothetical protein